MFRYSTISWSQFSTKKSLARASREPRSAEKSSNEDYFKFGGEGDGKGGRGPLTRQQLEKQILCLTIILTLIFFTSAPMQQESLSDLYRLLMSACLIVRYLTAYRSYNQKHQLKSNHDLIYFSIIINSVTIMNIMIIIIYYGYNYYLSHNSFITYHLYYTSHKPL